jgi:hypothetical protein
MLTGYSPDERGNQDMQAVCFNEHTNRPQVFEPHPIEFGPRVSATVSSQALLDEL